MMKERCILTVTKKWRASSWQEGLRQIEVSIQSSEKKSNLHLFIRNKIPLFLILATEDHQAVIQKKIRSEKTSRSQVVERMCRVLIITSLFETVLKLSLNMHKDDVKRIMIDVWTITGGALIVQAVIHILWGVTAEWLFRILSVGTKLQ